MICGVGRFVGCDSRLTQVGPSAVWCVNLCDLHAHACVSSFVVRPILRCRIDQKHAVRRRCDSNGTVAKAQSGRHDQVFAARGARQRCAPVASGRFASARANSDGGQGPICCSLASPRSRSHGSHAPTAVAPHHQTRRGAARLAAEKEQRQHCSPSRIGKRRNVTTGTNRRKRRRRRRSECCRRRGALKEQ